MTVNLSQNKGLIQMRHQMRSFQQQAESRKGLFSLSKKKLQWPFPNVLGKMKARPTLSTGGWVLIVYQTCQKSWTSSDPEKGILLMEKGGGQVPSRVELWCYTWCMSDKGGGKRQSNLKRKRWDIWPKKKGGGKCFNNVYIITRIIMMNRRGKN